MSEQAPSETGAPDDAATAGAGAGTPSSPSTTTVGDALRWPAAAACVGAAVIHFAYAPTHLEEDTLHGVFFLAVGWAQLTVAFALARWHSGAPTWVVAAAGSTPASSRCGA